MAKPSIQELSAQTKYDAAIKAANRAYDSSNDNDMERKKAVQQADALLKHVDPETVKKVEDFAKQLGLDFKIKKESRGSQFEPAIIIALDKNLKRLNSVQSAQIKIFITKNKSKVDGNLPDQSAERKLGTLIKYIQQKELAVNLKNIEQTQESTNKLNALIDKVINEEISLRNEDLYITPDGTPKTLTPNQKSAIAKLRPGATVSTAKSGDPKSIQQSTQSQKENMNEETPIPSATEIAGKIAEMMDSLKSISEGSQDVKMKKIADKASSQLEAAKATLEALTAHEVMLQEKEHETFVKQAGKKRKTIERYLNKKIKMPEVVEKLMKKMPEEKIAEMLKKANKDLDEEKVAGAIMKVALKEAYNSKNQELINGLTKVN